MPKSGNTRSNPEMSKRMTPTTPILEAPSYKQKRTCPIPAEQKKGASKGPVQNQLSQGRSISSNGVWDLLHRGHSYKQNCSARNGSPVPRGKSVGSPKVEQSSRKSKRTNSNVVNGDTPEVFYDAPSFHSASSSSTAGYYQKLQNLESKCAGLDLSDDGSEAPYDHGDTLSSGQTLQEDPQDVEPLLPPELVDNILGLLTFPSMREVIRLRAALGKEFKNAIHRPAFCRSRPDSEGEFSPCFFMTDDRGDLHWHGYDTLSREWTKLPSLNFAKTILPSPDPDLFKDYLVAGDGGLLCINVGKASGREKLVMCNPLTQQVKVLPPLNHERHPVLMHLKVDQTSGHYKVFVAGSAAIGTEELSLKTEEYDSRKGVWECPDGSDLPCPPFGLNEYQNGVFIKDSEREFLMCIAIVDTRGRGVLVYDIKKKKWAQGPMKLHIPLVRSEPNVSHLATTQIVECSGSVFVFSEQECGRDVYFFIHKLIPYDSEDFTWDEVMQRKRTGGRGLLVYPEFTCVPVSEQELCIFNSVEHTIEMINLNDPTEVTLLQAAPTSKGNRFHSLNPIGFVFRPSFKSVVCPRGHNPELRCDLKLREYCSECERRESSEPFVITDPHMNVDSEMINFPACGEEAGPEVMNCPACVEEAGSEVLNCPACGEEVGSEVINCPACVEEAGSEVMNCPACVEEAGSEVMNCSACVEAGSEVMNCPACVEKAGSEVITVPVDHEVVTDAGADHVEAVGSPERRQGRLLITCGNIAGQENKQQDEFGKLVRGR